MKRILQPLWFILRYLLVMVVFAGVMWLSVQLHEPTPLWQPPDHQAWRPIALLNDRLLLMGKEASTPSSHFTIRSLSFDGQERSRFHLKLGQCMYDVHSTGMLAAMVHQDGRYQLLHWDLPRQSKTLDMPATDENNKPVQLNPGQPRNTFPPMGHWTIIMSTDGQWCGFGFDTHLFLLHLGKYFKTFALSPGDDLKAISHDGQRLLYSNGSHLYLMDVPSRQVVKKIPLIINSTVEQTHDNKYFIMQTFQPESIMITWLSVDSGKIFRQVQLPLTRGTKPDFGQQFVLPQGDVVCCTMATSPLFPLATDLAVWLEKKFNLKLDWNWLKAQPRGTVHLVHPDGTHERWGLGNQLSSLFLPRDGQHLLAQYGQVDHFRYALFRLPLPSPYPAAVLYGLLAALPALLVQLIWRRMRNRPRPTTTS